MFARRSPKQGRSKETVEVIFEGALRELQKQDNAKISVNRIAEHAGVSVGSLYQYFPSKGALLTALLTRFVRRRFEAIVAMIHELDQREQVTGVITPLDVVMRTLVEGTFSLASSRGPLEGALVSWFVQVGDLGALRDVDEEFTSHLADALSLLARPPSRIRVLDRSRAAWVLLHTIRTVMLTHTLGHGGFERQALIDELVELSVRYLQPDRPA